MEKNRVILAKELEREGFLSEADEVLAGHGTKVSLVALRAMAVVAQGEVVAPLTAVPRLAAGVWHTHEAHADGALPQRLLPTDMVQVEYRDGMVPEKAFRAESFDWSNGRHDDGVIAKFKIIAPPAPAADAWRKIPIDAGTLHDLLLTRAKMHPDGGPLDAAGLASLAQVLKTVAEVRALPR